MRIHVKHCFVAIAILCGAATAASAGTIALDVTSDTQVFAPGSFTNIGWQFSVNSAITVDGLGVFDVGGNGLAENHQVGLWDNSGTLLAQTTVTNASTGVASVSSAGDWLFQAIVPLVLAPGTYVTGAFFATSADSVMANATISTVPQISFLASMASSQAVFAEPGAYGLVEPGVFAANISVQAVPDPASSLLLLGSSLLTLAIARRRA